MKNITIYFFIFFIIPPYSYGAEFVFNKIATNEENQWFELYINDNFSSYASSKNSILEDFIYNETDPFPIKYDNNNNIILENSSKNRILIGNCDIKLNCIKLIPRFIFDENYTFESSSFTNLIIKNDNVDIIVNDYSIISFYRERLDTFWDRIQQIGRGKWIYESGFIGEKPDQEFELIEISRDRKFIDFNTPSGMRADVEALRLSVFGGCVAFKVGGLWRPERATNVPFVRTPVFGSASANLNCDTELPTVCMSSSAIGDCRFYTQCLESRRQCGANGYSKTYGHKYCTRFSNHSFSRQGNKWRDGTLSCLQERLVFGLFENSSCDIISETAFDSHPECYTDNGSGISICDIWQDWFEIYNIIDFEDKFSDKGIKQLMATLKFCLTGYSDTLKAQVLEKVGSDISAHLSE